MCGYFAIFYQMKLPDD